MWPLRCFQVSRFSTTRTLWFWGVLCWNLLTFPVNHKECEFLWISIHKINSYVSLVPSRNVRLWTFIEFVSNEMLQFLSGPEGPKPVGTLWMLCLLLKLAIFHKQQHMLNWAFVYCAFLLLLPVLLFWAVLIKKMTDCVHLKKPMSYPLLSLLLFFQVTICMTSLHELSKANEIMSNASWGFAFGCGKPLQCVTSNSHSTKWQLENREDNVIVHV